MPQSTRRTSDVPIFHALPPELVPRSRVSIEAAETQWRDLLGVLKVQGQSIDRAYLADWAAELGVRDLLHRAIEEAGLKKQE